MTDSAALPEQPVERVIATLLRFTAQSLSSLVFIARLTDGRLTIEEAYPDHEIAGQRLKLAPGMVGASPLVFAVGAARIPLDWTRVCGGRPSHIASAPIGHDAMYLVALGTQSEPPPVDEIASVAEAIGSLLALGGSTALGRNLSKRMFALVDNLPLPLVFVDARSIEVALNDSARRLLDIAPDEAREHIVAGALAKMIAQADRGSAAQLQHDPLATAKFDVRHARQTFEVETRWIDQDGLAGRVWLFRDVSDEREAKRIKDQLVSNVSHELRTPLTSIVGALALLRDSPAAGLTGAQAALVGVASRNAERLGRLVNDLLDAEKFSVKELDLHRVETDLKALLQEVIALHEPYAEPRAIALRLVVPARPLLASVDPDRLVQVLGNLISNAVKFSPSGSAVQVRLTARGDGVRISVSDKGSGISPEFRSALFTRFAQENRAKVGQPGTGLGLAISKSIVEAHGGTIFLDPEVAVGATFHVDLPRSVPS